MKFNNLEFNDILQSHFSRSVIQYYSPEDFLLNFHKHEGCSSNHALQKLKRLLKVKKIGYAGTLDPFATGVLIIGSGKCTKMLQEITNFDKEYEFEATFGVETDTLDINGNITSTTNSIPLLNQIQQVLKEKFTGQIRQEPPRFSAININGQRAYKIARNGTDVDMSSKIREVTINNIEILHQIDNNKFIFKSSCSKGTYIRSLVRDIAREVNSLAHCTKLKRTAVGNFFITDSISLNINI